MYGILNLQRNFTNRYDLFQHRNVVFQKDDIDRICNKIFGNHKLLRLGAQSVTLLSTLRDPTQLRRRQCGFPSRQKKIQLGIRGFRTCFWEVEHPLCDV